MLSGMFCLPIQLTKELAQIRNTMASTLYFIARNRWCPSYPSVSALLASCSETQDPLGTRLVCSMFLYDYIEQLCRKCVFEDRFQEIIRRLPEWKDQRFPPPRVSQSQVSILCVHRPHLIRE